MAYKCTFQSPVLDALTKFLYVSMYFIYWTHNLAVRDFSCNALLIDFKIKNIAQNIFIKLLSNFQIDIMPALSDNAIHWSFIYSAYSVRMWNPPRRGTISSFFAVITFRAFHQSGWSNVIVCDVTFSFFDCSITKRRLEYIHV